MSSQFAIPFEPDELKKIIIDCIEMLEKTESFKKLENRVIEEITSNINMDDIKISESQFDRREAAGSISASEEGALVVAGRVSSD